MNFKTTGVRVTLISNFIPMINNLEIHINYTV